MVWAWFFGAGLLFAWFGALWIWYQRRESRDPRPLVLSSKLALMPATVARGTDSGLVARLILGSFAVSFFVASVEAVPSTIGGAVVLFGLCLYIALGALLYQTDRVGDGSVWLTADGIRQRSQGFEQVAKWKDVVALLPSPTGVALDVGGRFTRQRLAPRFWVGKGPQPIGLLAMSLQLGNIHQRLRLPMIEAMSVWAEDEFARHEIGTEAAVNRILSNIRSVDSDNPD